MASTDETLALVEGLAKIARTYRLDTLSVGEVSIERSQHEPPEIRRAPQRTEADTEESAEDEDAILFHSAGAE
jgi:hypothetical protein